MRKNILMIATVTMMAFAITACGSDSKDNETTKAETTVQVTTCLLYTSHRKCGCF